MENLLNEYKLLEISQQLNYEKFYLYSIVTHSTAIEGFTLTVPQDKSSGFYY